MKKKRSSKDRSKIGSEDEGVQRSEEDKSEEEESENDPFIIQKDKT